MASTMELPDGRQLAYELSYPHEPQRPTVLLSSLLATTKAVWDDVVEVLHRENLRVLRYDHPGHGGSTAPADLSSTTFDSMADDVHALLMSEPVAAAFSGHHQPGTLTPMLHAWIGCSLGAALGIVFATRYPGMVKRLVVCDTISTSPVNAGAQDGFTPRVKAARDQGTLEPALAATRERWLGREWLDTHPDKAAWLRGIMSQTTIDGYETCIAALTSASFDLSKQAPHVARSVERVRLVVGDKDEPLPETMKKLADEINAGFQEAGKGESKAELRAIPNAGHPSFIDGFDSWCANVLDFLRD